jgi:hypothetical protein
MNGKRIVLRLLLPILKKLIWANSSTRQLLQNAGVHILPANFYSPVPTLREIAQSFEYADIPRPPYQDDQIFPSARLSDFLDSLLPYAEEFCPLAQCATDPCSSFYWKNGQFSNSDALAYYCILRHTQPGTIVEIGSGYSTLIARQAVQKNGKGRLICVEPYPSPFLQALEGITLLPRMAQSITPEEMNGWLREDGDILFIDSTHTVKCGSDCLHIYLRLIPRLQRRVLIHSHDIFLPYGMPRTWVKDLHLYWTEQYLLLAFLTDNPRTRVVYSSPYNSNHLREKMDRWMDGKYAIGGSSIWYEYRPGMETHAKL